MTATQTKILTLCYQKQQANNQSKPEGWERWELRRWREEVEHGPRYQVSEWFGTMPERDSVHYRRAILSLEKQGLLTVGRRWGERMTNVKLTKSGETLAQQLTNPAAK